MTTNQVGLQIKVNGIVQGVGFRPFVFSLAQKLSLTGWVRNSSSGVEMVLNGLPEAVQSFLSELKAHPPVLAQIDKITALEIPPDHYQEFCILPSLAEIGEFVPISPDMSICPDCQRELFDPTDHRYRYPFINCTNCGPRFSIIKDIPYDRPNTTMANFNMCPVCQKEYKNPLDRRFHAQPIACPDCGPQIWFEANGKRLAEREDALQLARHWLRAGKIVAIKGLGGYHLSCDAANASAVTALRQRKKRSDKPFALMSFSSEIIRKYCVLTPNEETLLTSPQHPIVLLESLPDNGIAPEVALRQNSLGFMLPYTPLHLLLLEPEPGFSDVFVMTSGNLSEEPVAYLDDEAIKRLSNIADGFLLNDRPIHMRVDDSVYRVVENKSYPIRRARGYAPQAVQLPTVIRQTLACGAELKNTFCLTRENYAFVSHHIGDLENYETLQSFENGIEHFERLFRIKPEQFVADLHPDYLSTRYAVARSESLRLPLTQVQHHHAHLAACLADNGWNSEDPVIGLIFDGTGLGSDGAIWGGEVLVGGYAGYNRRFHLSESPLPGGDAAIRHPSRIALAYLAAYNIDWDPEFAPMTSLCAEERTILRSQINQHINTPQTTSMGRLFDAVSALIGIRQNASYEGQAAIELENCCDPNEISYYEIPFEKEDILIKPLLDQVCTDLYQRVPVSTISARFHSGIAHCAAEMCKQIRSETSLSTVAFSGGVWQNTTLLRKTLDSLRQEEFTPLTHRQVPTNDGGICLGQVMVANHI